MFFAVVNRRAAVNVVDPANIVVELAVAQEESFTAFGPDAGGGGAGGESAVLGGGGEASEEGEALVHAGVLPREVLHICGAVRDDGLRDFDTPSGGIGGGGEMDGGGVIGEVLVGEIGGDFLTDGEFEAVAAKFEDGGLCGRVVEEDSRIGEILAGDEVGMRFWGWDRAWRLLLRSRQRD